MSTVTHPPQMLEFGSPHGTLRRPLHGLQPQTTIPSASNVRGLGVSTITHQPRIQETPRPPRHGLQHQSTMPSAYNFRGLGVSTITHSPRPLLHEVQHLPGISEVSSSFETIRPPQYELQSQSVIPGDPHLSDPATSSITHPSVIPFPLDGTQRPSLHGTHLQNVIPGVPYLCGPEEEVETRTVSKKKLPASSRQLPNKKNYQGRIF